MTPLETRRSRQALVGIVTVTLGAVILAFVALEVAGVRMGWWWVLTVLLALAVDEAGKRVQDPAPTPPDVLADEARWWETEQAGDPELSGSRRVFGELGEFWRFSARQ